MKKSMFKYFAYSFVAAAALTLASCGSDESYDVTGNPDNLVYFNLGGDNTRSYMVIHTPVSHIGAFEAKFPAKILRPADAPTTVSVVMDNSLVEQFNAAHGTNYAAVPDGVVSLTNAVAHIQPSEYASADSIQVSVPESSLAQLTEKAYIVPFRISQVQGSGKVSQERGVAYIVINTEEKIINDGARSDQMRGTAIPAEEMAAWSCDKDDLAYVMNGDWEGWEDGTYVIDMKAEKKVTGLSFLPLGYLSMQDTDHVHMEVLKYALYWTADEKDQEQAWYRSIYMKYDTISCEAGYKDYMALNVRCVRDHVD